MSYEFYKVLHFAGVAAVLMAMSSVILGAMTTKSRVFPAAKFFKSVHGVGMLVVAVSGFGLLAKLGLASQFPAWAMAKVGIWLVLGMYALPVYRNPEQGKMWWTGLWALAVVAAYLARMKPF